MNATISLKAHWVICLFAAVLGACGSGVEPTASGQDTVYVGVAAAKRAALVPVFDAVHLALDELNASRPAGAPPLALRMPPDEQPSQVAVAAGFRDDPGVVGVVGHTGSAQTLEAAPIYADIEHGGRNALVAVTPTSTNPAVTRVNEWVFRVCPTDADGARTLARFAADSLRARRVAVVYRNDLFGRGFSRAFARELTANVSGIVVDRDPYLVGITAYDAYAERMARRGVDVLLVAGGAEDAAEMIRALRRLGLSPPVIGSDDLAALNSHPELAREFDGARYAAFFQPARPPTREGRDFVRAYQDRFGLLPDHRAALSYDAAMLIGRAVHEVGADRRRVRDWIAQVGRERPPHVGVTGDIRFDEAGDAVDKPVVIGSVGR